MPPCTFEKVFKQTADKWDFGCHQTGWKDQS